MGIQIKGLEGFIDRLNKLGRDVDTIVDSSVKDSALQIQKAAENNIQNMSVLYNGHIYDAKETGQLQREIHTERLGLCRYGVGTFVEYAPYVEFGTGSAGDPVVAHNTSDICARRSSKDPDALPKLVHFAPRPPCPFLRPAFELYRNAVSKEIRNAIVKAVSE